MGKLATGSLSSNDRKRRTPGLSCFVHKTPDHMPFPYLGGHRWLDLTRDERFFCAELYIALKQPDRLAAFIDRLNAALSEMDQQLALDKDATWAVGYEVAFYRDYIHALGAPVDGKLVHEIGSTRFSRKRTFDLCLFGPDRLVIIEAKVHQGLKGDQVKEFRRDAEHIEQLTGLERSKILLVGLWSSHYTKRAADSRDARVADFHGSIKRDFDAILHWNDLGIAGPAFDAGRDLFQVADELFGRKPGEFREVHS